MRFQGGPFMGAQMITVEDRPTPNDTPVESAAVLASLLLTTCSGRMRGTSHLTTRRLQRIKKTMECKKATMRHAPKWQKGEFDETRV
jgi:hypothetical protein